MELVENGSDESRFEGVINGWLPITAVDDDKLADQYPTMIRRLMRSNGTDANLRKAYDSLAQELYQRADERMRAALLEAVDVMIDTMRTDESDKLKFEAAKYLFERFRGKTPEVVELRQDKPFQLMFERIAVGPRAIAERLDTEDAEIVNEEPRPELKILTEEWELFSNWNSMDWKTRNAELAE